MDHAWTAPEVTPLTDDEGAAPEHANIRNGLSQSQSPR